MKQRFEIDAETRDALKKLGGLADSIRAITGETGKAEKAATSFGSVFKGTFASGLVQGALGGITQGIVGLGASMIKGAADLENYKTQFEVMLGSAEKGNKMFADLQKFGASTPFETTDLAAATQTMLGFGISSESVMGNLQMLGDVAGGNAEKLKSLTLTFSQIQSAGKLTGGDLLQMIGQGFNPLKYISEETGKSMSQLKAEMEKGAISADMVTAAFQKATGEGGQFNGMMEKQSKTFDGMISTLKDTVGMMLADLGTQLLPLIKSLVDGLTKIFSDPKIMGAIQQIGELLTSILGPILELIIPLLQDLLPPVIQVANAIGKLLVIAIKAVQPLLMGVVGIVQVLAPVIAKVGEAFGAVIVALQPLLDVLPLLIGEMILPLLPLVTALADLLIALSPAIKLVAQGLGWLIKEGVKFHNEAMKPLIDSVKWIIDNATAAINAISGIFGAGKEEPAASGPAVGYRGPGLISPNLAPAGVEPAPAATTTDKPDAATTDPKAGEKAKKARDEKYKLAVSDIKREAELARAQAEQRGASEAELLNIDRQFIDKRIAAAIKFKQDSQTLAELDHEWKMTFMGKAAKEQDDAAKVAAEAEYQRNREAVERWRTAEQEKAQSAVDAAQRMRDLRIALMADEEQQRDAVYQRDLDALQDKLDREQIAEEEFALAKAVLDKNRAKAEGEQRKKVADNAMSVAGDMLSNFKTVAGEQSDVAKAIAVAQAGMDTWRAANAAYASAAAIPVIGAVAGPIAAAAAVAAGLANVAKITSTKALAEGGILNRPTFVAGEAGAEVVAPLRALPGLLADTISQMGTPGRGRAINGRNGESFSGEVRIGVDTFGRGTRGAKFRKMARQL